VDDMNLLPWGILFSILSAFIMGLWMGRDWGKIKHEGGEE